MESYHNDSVPVLSVMMVTYNQEKYIQQSVEAVLCQSFRDFEFIIVDDGSTDQTPQLLAGFDDSRITLLSNDGNRGISYSRNRAMAATSGELAAFVDSDDLVHPKRFEKQVAFFKGHSDYTLTGTSVLLINQHDTVLKPWRLNRTNRTLKPMMAFHNCFITSSVMFRRGMAVDFIFPESLGAGEDYLLWWHLLQRGKGCVTADLLTSYRVHPQSTMQRAADTIARSEEEVYRKLFEDLSIQVDETLLDLHLMLKGGEKIYSAGEAMRMRDWLLQLAGSMAAADGFSPAGTLAVVLNRWWKVCAMSKHNFRLFVQCFFHLPFYFRLIKTCLP